MKIKEKFEKETFRIVQQLNESFARAHYKGIKPCIVEAYILSTLPEYQDVDIYETRCSKYDTCDECQFHWLGERYHEQERK